MRPVHLCDLYFAALALRDYAPEAREGVMAQALQRADTADRYRKRLRRGHPIYGLGTLSSAMETGKVSPDRAHSHLDDLQCMLIVITGVLQRARVKSK
jgi:hypothetical protein